MSLAIVASRALAGIDASEVAVEVHLGPGRPSFTIVGLPDTEVCEAKDRVHAALNHTQSMFERSRRNAANPVSPAYKSRNTGSHVPESLCVTININSPLTPVSVSKTSTAARSGRPSRLKSPLSSKCRFRPRPLCCISGRGAGRSSGNSGPGLGLRPCRRRSGMESARSARRARP
ncbi:MAG: hypothetical protein EXR29_03700 [Betaproteobacteria bacterium]|nr:hypothetical protein [Betaproteobacteria bacterium]